MMPADADAVARQVECDGWAVTAPLFRENEIAPLERALEPLIASNFDRGGVRNLLRDSAAVQGIARDARLRALVTAVLGPDCGAVRVIYFDKSPDANWRVAWHQDLAIAVRERREVAGYGPWSEKDGVPHVHPPDAVLQGIVALRVHLDDCGEDNGPLRVLPGTHRAGRLSPSAIDACKERVAPRECLAARGAVIALRPLLLHASSPARVPRHRRVLHIEYAAPVLAGELAWHTWMC